jgi:hypothetical protein
LGVVVVDLRLREAEEALGAALGDFCAVVDIWCPFCTRRMRLI